MQVLWELGWDDEESGLALGPSSMPVHPSWDNCGGLQHLEIPGNWSTKDWQQTEV